MEHTKSTITNKCSYKTRARSTEHTEKYYYKQMLLQDLSQVDGAHKREQMLLQDPRQVDGAHRRVLLQTNALTRPLPGRRSTQEYYYKQNTLQDQLFTMYLAGACAYLSFCDA